MSLKKPIYLDYHATTPVDERVLKAMLPYFTVSFGNPASNTHTLGWDAQAAVSVAREGILKNLNAPKSSCLIFTSGATEANNLALKGVAAKNGPHHFISQVSEHKSVLEPLHELEKTGHEVTLLPVNNKGLIDPDDLKSAFRENTRLVSIMWANNEIGVLQDIAKLAELTHAHSQALFHTDATQAVGKIPVDLSATPIDLMSFSAHKIYGPKGVGALYASSPTPSDWMEPLFHGGGHERGLRAGTLNVPGIIGLAKALELCLAEIPAESERLLKLKDLFWNTLTNLINGVVLNGDAHKRLPHNLNFFIPGVSASSLMIQIPEIAFSSGSACASGDSMGSHVIAAMGKPREVIEGTLRISFGRFTCEEEVREAANKIANSANQLKSTSN